MANVSAAEIKETLIQALEYKPHKLKLTFPDNTGSSILHLLELGSLRRVIMPASIRDMLIQACLDCGWRRDSDRAVEIELTNLFINDDVDTFVMQMHDLETIEFVPAP